MILIKVFDPGSFNVTVRACPEFVACPLTLMVEAASCNVGVIVTLVVPLSTLAVYPTVPGLKAGVRGPGEIVRLRKLLLFDTPRLTVTR